MTQSDFSLSGKTYFPDGQVRDATITLSEGVIARIDSGIRRGADLATDGVILPGFIDLQVNGAYGFDFTNDAATVTAVAARLPETGVTSFLPTLVTSEFSAYPARIHAIKQAIQAQASESAQILGVHLEGPYLNPKRKGAHPPSCIRKINLDEIRAWADPSVTRIVTLAPELEGALEAIRMLRAAGLVVSEGHSDATYAQALAGFAAGANWGTHLYNAMAPLQHREPGLIGALLTSAVPCGMIVDGIHAHPAMTALAYRSKGAGQIMLITDSMAAMGMGEGRYLLGEHAVVVDSSGARLEDGTLAGSVLTMDQALRNTLAFTGCGLGDAVRMTSTNAARLLGLSRKGMIAPGCDADLVVLSPENSVLHTFTGGRLAYSRQ